MCYSVLFNPLGSTPTVFGACALLLSFFVTVEHFNSHLVESHKSNLTGLYCDGNIHEIICKKEQRKFVLIALGKYTQLKKEKKKGSS